MPIPWDTLGKTFGGAGGLRTKDITHCATQALVDGTIHGRRAGSLENGLDAIIIRAAESGQLPSRELVEAVAASSATHSLRVVIRILIEGNSTAGVFVTEDVSTAPAVMASSKVCEISCARSLVTEGGFVISLEKKG